MEPQCVAPGIVVALLLGAPVVCVAVQLEEKVRFQLDVQAVTASLHHRFALLHFDAGALKQPESAAFENAWRRSSYKASPLQGRH